MSEPYACGRYIAAASANEDSQVIKASSALLGMLIVGNSSASIRYVKFYNQVTAPTSADTPVLVFLVPGNAAGSGFNLPIPQGGLLFDVGIAFRMTTAQADNSAAAVTAGDIVLTYGYQ